MKKMLMKFMAFMGLILFSAAATSAGEVAIDGKITIDEDRLREVIKEVIKENPKLIYETINAYAKHEKKRKLAERLESSFKNRINGLTVDEKINPVMGSKDAPITIIEFTDFQCPYCSRAARTVERVLKKYPGKVRLALKNNPLDFHKQALPAASAALAANKQGKFWEYHDLLFKNASDLNEEMFVKFAEDLSLDVEKFNKDRNSDEIIVQIEAEREEAEKYKLKGTPSFVANGIVIRGAQKIDYFSKVVDRLLAEKKAEKKQK
ncbi:thioredoxin domain-containing protein [Desulfonema magnum]|uniref:Thioredoxin-fold containing protein n=1 Tax=Desulfonema magnum TaxID=45655 RepID=A0A975BSX3_9BACT|nr:thioredoxin domain-containing protein [Desulfonema magnum]QTA90475.1 Thioredoxin-fold containing protein [Desulfonema magnum]